jgi:hypothetical protein
VSNWSDEATDTRTAATVEYKMGARAASLLAVFSRFIAAKQRISAFIRTETRISFFSFRPGAH